MAKKRVKNNKKPKSTVTNTLHPLVAKSTRDSVWFDFRSKDWLASVKVKGFTNFVSGREEYMKNHFNIMHTLIPKVIADWNNIISKRERHCHPVSVKRDVLAREVAEKIMGYPLGTDVDLWQFGFFGSVRIICINHGAEKALIPVFIDHHHLLEPDQNYNQRDFEKLEYCAVCDFIKDRYA